ncbi:MAG: hypothetical protein WC346_11310 [Methanogenium sp.]|jgi:hypothetical protein
MDLKQQCKGGYMFNIGVNKETYEYTLSGPWILSPIDTQFCYKIIDNELIIKFQCTNSIIDVIDDLKITLKKLKTKKIRRYSYCGDHANYKMHSGISDIVEKFWDTFIRYFYNKIMDKEIKKITVLGFSLGASISIGLVNILMENLYTKDLEIRCFAFAPFKIFSWLLPKIIKKRLKNATLIVNRGDIVWLHPLFWFYKHYAGKIIKIGKFRIIPRWKYHNPKEYIKSLEEMEKQSNG